LAGCCDPETIVGVTTGVTESMAIAGFLRRVSLSMHRAHRQR